MSPLEIEAYRGVALKVSGRKLESNQLKKIDKDGREFMVFPGETGFTLFLRGQKLIIPDVPGMITVETHGPSFTLYKESSPQGLSDPQGDIITFAVEAEGWGIARGKERPSINKQEGTTAKYLGEQPREIWLGNQKQLRVLWRKKKVRE